MKARAVDPNVDSSALLSGAQFIDAYSIAIDDAALDARHAAEKMLARAPRWIEALLALRNHLVTPFGLKTSTSNEASASETIGIFPIVSQSPDRLAQALTIIIWIFASRWTSRLAAMASASPRPRWCARITCLAEPIWRSSCRFTGS